MEHPRSTRSSTAHVVKGEDIMTILEYEAASETKTAKGLAAQTKGPSSNGRALAFPLWTSPFPMD
jgi:hypothetical protein